MKIYLDANSLFAASLGGEIARLVALMAQRGEKIMSSAYAVQEARRNLDSKRPFFLPAFDRLVAGIETVLDAQFPLPVSLAAKDQPVLCAAIRGGCTHFLTGDKHDFGHLYRQTVQGVLIVSPLLMADILENERRG